MELKNKEVLVTGASGFIGSHLVEELLKKGAKVFALLRNPHQIGKLGELKRTEEINFILGNLKNLEEMKSAAINKEVIFHLGSLNSVNDSYNNPNSFFETNCIGTFNVLCSAKEAGIKKMIITSSSEVYRDVKYTPVDEKHPMCPQSPYAISKLIADNISMEFYRHYTLPVSIARLFNVFGPRQTIKPIVPSVIKGILREEKIKLTSLDVKRDFIYVKDVVDVLIKMAECEVITGGILNIGTGQVHSIGEILDISKKIIGKERFSNWEITGMQEKTEKDLICDNLLAKKILGWEPKYSFHRGMVETIEYFKEKLTI